MAEEKQKTDASEELNKALNEIDVLPDADKEIVRVDSEHFKFSKIDYKLIENHQEAFDLDMMENRYTDYLLKYDYIVGDISYEKLRLRGFYEDYRKGVPIDMKISNLEDYLVEYCSFGCQYFVFERVEKAESDPESYFKNKKSNRPNQSKRPNKRQSNRNNKNRNKQNNRRTQKNQSTKKSNSGQKETKNFQVKKKETQQDHKKTQSSNKQQPKNKDNKNREKVQFKIRKKKD
ncbi:MAG TPA: YutD family protein [Atopostipes sp.]|nr:YutD family protein [Atopostipes sp.]